MHNRTCENLTLLQVNSRSKKGHKSLGPKSILIFFSDPDRVPSLPPTSSGNPGRFTYRHFASGNFHCFAGLVNPYWGLPEPPPATHPGIHTGARFRTPGIPSATRPPTSPWPPTISTLAPRPAAQPTDPSFQQPPRKRKACGFSSRVGVGLFPPSPVTSPALPDWPMPRR